MLSAVYSVATRFLLAWPDFLESETFRNRQVLWLSHTRTWEMQEVFSFHVSRIHGGGD